MGVYSQVYYMYYKRVSYLLLSYFFFTTLNVNLTGKKKNIRAITDSLEYYKNKIINMQYTNSKIEFSSNFNSIWNISVWLHQIVTCSLHSSVKHNKEIGILTWDYITIWNKRVKKAHQLFRSLKKFRFW